MLKAVKGVYRNGKVELLEQPSGVEGAAVLVTFLAEGTDIDLRSRGIDEAQASDLRGRLKTFTDDWERPEMQAYDEL